MDEKTQNQIFYSHEPKVVNEEIELIQRIALRDRGALEAFYYRYSPNIGRYLMKMLKEQELVDEAINDVMLTVWQIAERYDPAKGKLTTWLFGIAHNIALKLLERERHRRSRETPEVEFADIVLNENSETPTMSETSTTTPESVVLGWELGEMIVWALDQLSPNHRSVMELTFSGCHSYQEISDISGCSVNTVKTRMFNARKKIAALLSNRGYSIPTSTSCVYGHRKPNAQIAIRRPKRTSAVSVQYRARTGAANPEAFETQ